MLNDKRRVVCNVCEQPISEPLPIGTNVYGYVLCISCIHNLSNEAVKYVGALATGAIEEIRDTAKEQDNCVWHLGAFEDIGLDSGMNTDARMRISNLTPAVMRLIPDSDLDNKFVDVGCNCGHFIRQLWMRGARRLVGVEPRKEHVDFALKWGVQMDAQGIVLHQGRAEDISAHLMDDSIVLVLGLLYHLSEEAVDELFNKMVASKIKYGIIESRVWSEETLEKEPVANMQNAVVDEMVWRPTPEGIEGKFVNHGMTFERMQYQPFTIQPRALWKVRV